MSPTPHFYSDWLWPYCERICCQYSLINYLDLAIVCEEEVLSDSEQPYEPDQDYNVVPIENYMSPSQNNSSNIPLVSSNAGRTTSSEIVIENDSMDQVRLFRTRSDIIQQQSTGYSMSKFFFIVTHLAFLKVGYPQKNIGIISSWRVLKKVVTSYSDSILTR